MTDPGDTTPDAFDDALIAARLCAVDPRLGGMVLRGGGDLRNVVIDGLRAQLSAGAPVRRVPTHIDDERLLGGLDLGATLARGERVARAGLLAEADGGLVVIPMAERLPDGVAARIAAVLDTGEVVTERDGVALSAPARFVVVAQDDGASEDERVAGALAERLAFHVDLTANHQSVAPKSVRAEPVEAPFSGSVEKEEQAFDRLRPNGAGPHSLGEDALTAIVSAAAALGIASARGTHLALRAARAAAVLAGRAEITDDDLILAVRLVLAPRATRIPAPEQSAPEDTARAPPEDENGEGDDQQAPQPLDDVVLAAALAALPKNVLARVAAGAGRGPGGRTRGAGERRKSPTRGRPVGVRAGLPRGGLRLSLIDTLRAAAPWQKLRSAEPGKVAIRRDDLRIRRFETRAEAVTIFAVDASGSAAAARLAEAKGAVELLLAEAYVKRAHVALIAFRGQTAELLLPPTRSLARARRSLGDLPGGGGTPLAAGLVAAREVAEIAKARGRTPFVVVLTDGRANVSLDGGTVRATAESDADSAARAIRLAGIAGAFVDISARPRPDGVRLAAAMGARYLPLPRADAATLHAAVGATRG